MSIVFLVFWENCSGNRLQSRNRKASAFVALLSVSGLLWKGRKMMDPQAALQLAKELLEENELQGCMLQIAEIEYWIRKGGFFSSEQRKELQKIKVDCHKLIMSN